MDEGVSSIKILFANNKLSVYINDKKLQTTTIRFNKSIKVTQDINPTSHSIKVLTLSEIK